MTRDLNETLIFVRVVQCGSFTSAARQLRLPKSTVSRKVQELEQRIGVQLLHRTTRKLGTTEAGSLYFDLCEAITEDLERAESAVSRLQDGPRGWLRVGAPPAVANSCIAPLLGDFHARYPEVGLVLHSVDGVPDLISETLDIALVAGGLPDCSLAARKIASFDSSLFASPRYLDLHGAPDHPDDLRDHRLLALEGHCRDPRFVWSLSDGAEALDVAVEPFLICNDAVMLHGPLLAGEGLALGCESMMMDLVHRGALRKVMQPWRGPTIDLHVVFRRGRTLPPKVRVFIDFLVECLSPSLQAARPHPGTAVHGVNRVPAATAAR